MGSPRPNGVPDIILLFIYRVFSSFFRLVWLVLSRGWQSGSRQKCNWKKSQLKRVVVWQTWLGIKGTWAKSKVWNIDGGVIGIKAVIIVPFIVSEQVAAKEWWICWMTKILLWHWQDGTNLLLRLLHVANRFAEIWRQLEAEEEDNARKWAIWRKWEEEKNNGRKYEKPRSLKWVSRTILTYVCNVTAPRPGTERSKCRLVMQKCWLVGWLPTLSSINWLS